MKWDMESFMGYSFNKVGLVVDSVVCGNFPSLNNRFAMTRLYY